jgi:hypothetical protein
MICLGLVALLANFFQHPGPAGIANLWVSFLEAFLELRVATLIFGIRRVIRWWEICSK